MRTSIYLALFFFAGAAEAQAVYKCRDAAGQPVYQSQPCADNKPAERVWVNEVRPLTADEVRKRRLADASIAEAARKVRESNARYAASGPRHWSPSGSQSQTAVACAGARSEYERVQKDFTLNRNVDLLRRLEADIRRYCSRRP